MPQTPQVRKHARAVAKRLQLEPWYEHQAEVLKVVGEELGIELKPAFPQKRKRKRQQAPECVVCLEPVELVVLAPCGHRQTCRGCLARCHGKCPVCRVRWTGMVEKVFD